MIVELNQIAEPSIVELCIVELDQVVEPSTVELSVFEPEQVVELIPSNPVAER